MTLELCSLLSVTRASPLGEIIYTTMGRRAKRLFLIFAYLTLILVVAAFASIVAGTFAATVDEAGAIDIAASESAASVAMISLMFILVAILFGFLVYRRGVSMGVSTIIGIIAICICMGIGMNWHPIYLTNSTWMIIVGIYIAIASVAPVWILLQPRDYLSSFLLYAMLAVALIGVVGAHPSMDAMPAFAGFNVNGQYLFPVLFTTVACGAISGFHSLVSSGTTSKQLDKESDAKPIAYGGMLLECVLAILTLCAVGYSYAINGGTLEGLGVTGIFAGGISKMVATIPGLAGSEGILFKLLSLTYSAFCLTSLDTATRLARFMFQEFWLDDGEEATGFKAILVNPYVATIITVVLGVLLGLNGYVKIWALFGAANQLLAALGLLAVATWLGNVGKNNKMFLFPMAFMLVVTICSLLLTIKGQIAAIAAGGADWGPYAQVILGALLVILAIFLAIEGIQTLSKQSKKAV